MRVSFTENNKAISDLNEKLLEFMNDKGMIEPYWTSSLVDLLTPENTSELILTKYPNSIRMNDFLINRSIPVTLYTNALTFRDSNKSSKLDGDHLKMMANFNINVNQSNPQDQKLVYEFGNEMNFDINWVGRKIRSDKSFAKLLESPGF